MLSRTFMDDHLLLSLIKEYGNLRAVARLLEIDHPVLRAVVRKKPEINGIAQTLMQSNYRKPKELSLKYLLMMDNCAYCGVHPSMTRLGRMTLDHIVPRSVGGENNLSNMVGACEDCNTQKSDKDLLTFLLERRA